MRRPWTGLLRRGVVAANIVMPFVSAMLWYDVATSGPSGPARDHSGIGFVLVTLMRGT